MILSIVFLFKRSKMNQTPSFILTNKSKKGKMKKISKRETVMGEKLEIALAKREDAPFIAQIYAYYTEKTAVSFDYLPLSAKDFEEKIEKIPERYPFLVAKKDGLVVGYAYASPFKARPAYDRAVETTVYLATDCRRQGIGRVLYEALEEELKKQGVLNLNACIAVTKDPKDPYLKGDSPLFHEKMGYQKVAHFTSCGRKFDRWYDMIWMEKLINQEVSP
jgi:phosphinothricin acetyltransferase